jgi:uncharacterized protein (DUF1015 family)
MTLIRAFNAWVPSEDPQGVTTLPFDRYSRADIKNILAENPKSFLHVIFPHGVDPKNNPTPQEETMKAGREKFLQMAANGIWNRYNKAVFLYEQNHNGQSYLGLMGAVPTKAVVNRKVKGHEETLEQKEAKLSHYLSIVGINAEPVNLTFKDSVGLASQWKKYTHINPPNFTFEDPVLGKHSLWIVYDTVLQEEWNRKLEDCGSIYIADGHHRVAASVRLAEQKNNLPGTDQFLGIVFAGADIDLLPFHRLLRTEALQTAPENWINHLLHIGATPLNRKPLPTEMALWHINTWYVIPVPQNKLPGIHLIETILTPIFGITDIRNDARLGFSGGHNRPEKLETLANQPPFSIAIHMPPVSKEMFFNRADAGLNMPPKSTWFEPKLLNGLVVLDLL